LINLNFKRESSKKIAREHKRIQENTREHNTRNAKIMDKKLKCYFNTDYNVLVVFDLFEHSFFKLRIVYLFKVLQILYSDPVNSVDV
jgi:hypothetical protein